MKSWWFCRARYIWKIRKFFNFLRFFHSFSLKITKKSQISRKIQPWTGNNNVRWRGAAGWIRTNLITHFSIFHNNSTNFFYPIISCIFPQFFMFSLDFSDVCFLVIFPIKVLVVFRFFLYSSFGFESGTLFLFIKYCSPKTPSLRKRTAKKHKKSFYRFN